MNADAPAVRYGLGFGAALAVLGLLNGGIIAATVASVGLGLSLVACVVFFAALWLLFESGSFAARTAGTVASGVLTGAIAGFLGGAGFALSSTAGNIVTGHLAFHGALTVAGTIIDAVVFGCIFTGFGAGMGALGALFRQSRARGRPQTQP
jgi:hypothetical protein